ncbi:MAG: VOC family protein [Burkholderiaceae bacterium]|nr:VOC family protein [Burkholderiaceae bacterium]
MNDPRATQGAALDHLVVAARTLEEGAAWCAATLGVTPASGGRHALMSTHNRVFSVATAAFARAYFEIIAIDADAPPPGRARWFGLDDPALQAALDSGPRLVAWVARVADLDAALAALAAQGIDAGRVLPASRMTPHGELRWRIAVRDDGARLFGGALPTLIEWGEVHPADSLSASGATLAAITLRAPEGSPLRAALDALGIEGARFTNDATAAAFGIELDTPRGRLQIDVPT